MTNQQLYGIAALEAQAAEAEAAYVAAAKACRAVGSTADDYAPYGIDLDAWDQLDQEDGIDLNAEEVGRA